MQISTVLFRWMRIFERSESVARCNCCKITILDDVKLCPLCGSPLEEDGIEKKQAIYPELELKPKKLVQIAKGIAQAGILIELLLILVNIAMNCNYYWCEITGASIAYVILILYTISIPHMTLRRRILFLSLGLLMIGFSVDWMIGFRGWAISVAMPIQILFMDIVILVLFLYQRKEFQAYIWITGLNLLLSMIPLIAFLLGYRILFGMMIIAIAVTALELLMIMIQGGRKTDAELKRRFHV